MKKAVLSALAVLAFTASVAHAAPRIPVVSNETQATGTETKADKPLFPTKGSQKEVGNGDVFIVVNQKPIFFERPEDRPFIDSSGRTQVPVRFVSEALGKKVNWDGDTQTVTIADQVKLRIKSSVVQAGERTIHMDTIARLKDDRTFVPVRFVSEALGQKVDWDENAHIVIITTPGKEGAGQ